MHKDLFSKLFFILFVSFSIFTIIDTQIYKYVYSKPFIFLIIINLIIAIIFFFKNKRFLIYVNLLIFFISIFFINLFLFFTDPSNPLQSERLKFMNKNNFYPTVPPITLLKDEIEIFPLSGLSNVDTVTANENGYWGTYKSDEFGFNNITNQHEKILNTEKKKLIFIGDSMTLGSAVYQNENFVSIVNENPDITALNLGYGGNGLLLALASYIEYGKHIENAYLIFCFYEGNDFFEYEVVEKKHPVLIKYLEDNFSQNLLNFNEKKDKIIRNKMIHQKNRALKNKNKEKYNLYYKEILQLYTLRKKLGLLNNKKEMLAYSEENFNDFEKLLDKYKDLVKQNNSNFIFLYIPSREHFYLGHPYTDSYNKVLSILNNKDIKFIDLYSEMKKTGQPLDFYSRKIMRHFNSKGHKETSRIIIDYFNKKN